MTVEKFNKFTHNFTRNSFLNLDYIIFYYNVSAHVFNLLQITFVYFSHLLKIEFSFSKLSNKISLLY